MVMDGVAFTEVSRGDFLSFTVAFTVLELRERAVNFRGTCCVP